MSFRIEEKLLVHPSRVGDFLEWIDQLDGETLHPARLVSSTYFDNAALGMFSDSEEGLVPRKKIRIRSYASASHARADSSLEIKTSSVEGRYKSTRRLAGECAAYFLSQGYFDQQYGICKPVVRVEYMRSYFQATGMRITIDRQLTYNRVTSADRRYFSIRDPAIAVEIKADFDTEQYLILNTFPFQRVRFSKYSRAVSAIRSGIVR